MRYFNVNFKITFLFVLVVFQIQTTSAQIAENDPDKIIKEAIYKQVKDSIRAYNMKQFDDLFLEFLAKNNSPKITFSKEEYYNYTIKIASFSDRLKLLYPKRKAEAEENKKVWLAKMYVDYLKDKLIKK